MGALFGFTGPRDDKILAKMGEALAHRGRGRAYVHQTEEGSLVAQPAHADPPGPLESTGLATDGRVALGVAGTITANGVKRGRVGAEDLLTAYVANGPRFVESLRGAFVIAVLDGGKLLLTRDGVGVRSLYWATHEGRTLFAVEPKGILAVPGFPRRVRPAAVAQYLSTSFVPSSGTMLEGLFGLEAGSRLEVLPGEAPRRARWFTFEDDDEIEVDADWVARFRETFASAVAERLPPSERVGVFLSGGLDSSIVAAEARRQHGARVISYAVHFGTEYANELDFARLAARAAGTEHVELLVRPKRFLPLLRKILWHLDDPIGDPITVPNFELAARASEDVRFVLNGEGGDPVFGGPKNLPMMLEHWYGGIDRAPGFRERAYLASYRRSYDDWQRVLAPEFARAIDPARDLEGVFRPYFDAERPRTLLNKLSALNIREKGAELILPKVDRMTGAWGIVPASPLFDERLVRASFAMAPSSKLASGIEKIVMKRAYEGIVPKEILRRPKSGMRVPVRYWFQGEMKRYAKKILSKREIRRAGIFDERRVGELLAYDTSEPIGRHGLRLWMLLTFEIWRRIFVENEGL